MCASCMRVCKHGCGFKMFCSSRAYHASTNLKKVFLAENSTNLLYLPIPPSAKTWKMFINMLCQFFFFAYADTSNEKTLIFESTFFAKPELITRTSFVYKTSRLVRVSLLISAITKSFVFFLGKVIL